MCRDKILDRALYLFIGDDLYNGRTKYGMRYILLYEA